MRIFLLPHNNALVTRSKKITDENMHEFIKIAILITCHNRRQVTLRCLECIEASHIPGDIEIDVILVDDGSTDGTSEQVLHRYPKVKIVHGDGNLYWNGGMRVAFEEALKGDFTHYLWLNDDTLLYPHAIASLVAACTESTTSNAKPTLIVGSTQDSITKELSYGGLIRASMLKRTQFRRLQPKDYLIRCDSMNGNCVLIPDAVPREIGGIEPRFAHAIGDIDYGLRATNAGFTIYVAVGFVGSCSNNSKTGSFNDPSISTPVRMKKMLGPKGLPLIPWMVFTKRHAGIFWPLYWIWPYVKLLAKGVLRK